jgi:hypothetical protein
MECKNVIGDYCAAKVKVIFAIAKLSSLTVAKAAAQSLLFIDAVYVLANS